MSLLSVSIGGALLLCACTSGPDPEALEAPQNPPAPSGEVPNEAEKVEEPSGPPPLVVSKDAPLLLEEPADPEKTAAGGSAPSVDDNSACFVCHVNYKEESLVSWHAAEEIGCVDCHGKSYAHRNDENNTTPPEIMYPADRIDKLCEKCHPEHDISPARVVARWLKRSAKKTDPGRIVCTDCHGDHRLELRTVRWNKSTGELLTGSEEG
jgi:hypothetical protein